MKLIVWLGNPGKEYENTRHNVGFLMIEEIRKHYNFPDWKDSRFHAVISEWIIHGEKIILMKPMTYMNLSWDAVSSCVGFYKLDPKSDVCIISDDIDMEFGKVRYRAKWSHGGQNGLKDIILKIWTDEFTRVKIGIGRHEKMSVSDWVLSKFSKEEKENLNDIFPQVIESVMR